ncbi:MAG: ATPase [Bacteroidetes bacterium 43-16]|mgnify:CR=1 FL=1|nr:MAG: ATPase [Bacteroidetes bacterium 43-16]
MELKTKIHAEDNKQEIIITRTFDLPLELLFKAYEEPELVAQWMGTKVLQLENRQHGSWRYETAHEGKVVFAANGVILEFVPDQRITRTFQMENSNFPVQLEFLEFESLSPASSRLRMQIIFKSVAFRDQLLQMPFAAGLSMAHDRLQDVLTLNNK